MIEIHTKILDRDAKTMSVESHAKDTDSTEREQQFAELMRDMVMALAGEFAKRVAAQPVQASVPGNLPPAPVMATNDTLKGGWESWKAAVFPCGMAPVQERQLYMAFVSGAFHFLQVSQRVAKAGEVHFYKDLADETRRLAHEIAAKGLAARN